MKKNESIIDIVTSVYSLKQNRRWLGKLTYIFNNYGEWWLL